MRSLLRPISRSLRKKSRAVRGGHRDGGNNGDALAENSLQFLVVARAGTAVSGTSAKRVVDFEVDSVSSFLKAWLAATLLIMSYAWVDLRFHPHLTYETSFSLTPDVTRLSDLWDWGGRLLHHGAVGLLLLNAIALGGIAALVVRGVLGVVRRLRRPLDTPRVSIVPASVPTSVPPPAP